MNDRKLLFCILFVFGCLAGSFASADDSKDALKTVLKSLRARDAKALEASLEGIIEVGGKKSISGLLKLTGAVPPGSQTVYWSLLEGISSFVDKPALEELGSYIYKNKSRAIARDLLHALQTSRTRNVVYALAPIVRKGPDSLRLKAIGKLARVRNHEAVDVLVEVVEIEEKKSREEHTSVMVAAVEGLTMITGQQFGTSAVNNDIWFLWTADATGLADITVCNGGASLDTKVAAWPSACPQVPGTILACNDDTCGLQSSILIPVTSGSTYMLQIGNFPGAIANSTGSFSIVEDAPVLNPANGHFYDYVAGVTDFDSARAAAEAMSYLGSQGHLATIADASENTFLSTTFGQRAWLGAYQDFNDPNYSEPLGGWVWVTGEPWTYDSWSGGEPNDSGGNEHYAETFANGAWNDQPLSGNNTVQGFYVEYGDVSIPNLYCSGDGANPTGCPCGNLGSDGEGCANGSGVGGQLRSSGSASVSAGDLVLSGTQLISSQPGLYFQGNNAINSGNGNPFGDGLRCAGGGVIRLQVRFADSAGTSATSIDIGAKGGVSAGDVRRYQLWYRDPGTSPCNSLFNLSNGYEIAWGS